MALSTQKDFFRLQYVDDDDPYCPEAKQFATTAKTFESCRDIRAWNCCGEQHSRYLLDEVHFNEEAGGGDAAAGRHVGRFGMDALMAMSKPELIKHVQDLYKSLANKNNEMLRLERLLEETRKKLAKIHNIVEENGQLRDMLATSNEALQTLNREHALIQQNIRRRSRDTGFGELREQYEFHRANGNLTPAEEVKYLKRQLGALENDANRAAVAEAEAETCREEVQRLQQRLRAMPMLVSVDGQDLGSGAEMVGRRPDQVCPEHGTTVPGEDSRMGLDSRRVQLEASTDVAYLQARINELSVELRTLRNIEDETAELRRELQDCLQDGRIAYGGSSERQGAQKVAGASGGSSGKLVGLAGSRRETGSVGADNWQGHEPDADTSSLMSRKVEEVLNERDRLRSQLDKMTSIEEKLMTLKDRANSCADIERERDELRELVAIQQADICRLQGEQASSLESLRSLERENGMMKERASLLAKSGDELKVQLRNASDAAVVAKQMERDLDNTRLQLATAEQAIAEYEKDIQDYIAQLRALQAQLADSGRAASETEERLRALDELESEVNTLQAQLSAALALQKTQQNADLVAAVKLTLAYVQNKLTSRETMGNEEELERLKAELLQLRDKGQAESQAEIERLQTLLSESAERDHTALLKATGNTKQIRDEILDLRSNLADAGHDLKAVIVKAKKSVNTLQGKVRRSSMMIDEQQNTIEGLQEHAEHASIRLSNVEEDLSAQVRELLLDNANLRGQIQILNDQMNQLAALITEIERERDRNKGLQAELNEMEAALTGLQGAGARTPELNLEVQHMGDALHKCTSQLEAECEKNQNLEQELDRLRKHLAQLKVKLRRFVSRSSELELADMTSKELADRIAQMGDRNAFLEGELGRSDDDELRVGQYNKSQCQCGCLMVNESDDRFNQQNSIQDELWRKHCEKILSTGIGSLNLRELSELHQLIYLAGLRYTHEIRRRRFAFGGESLKEKHNYYVRKEFEHQQKVRELQHQLHEIKVVMRQLKRDEAARVKREGVLHKAKRALNKSDELLHRRCIGSSGGTPCSAPTTDRLTYRSVGRSVCGCGCKGQPKRTRSKSVM